MAESCKHPGHNPPADALTSGQTKWTCPLCGAVTIIGMKGPKSYDRPILDPDSFAVPLSGIQGSGVQLKDLVIVIPVRPSGCSG